MNEIDQKEAIEELIRNAESIETMPEFLRSKTFPVGRIKDRPVWPALAIPVRKKQSFVCPKDHLTCLEKLLPQTTKMIIVGWRGMEDHFVNMLLQALGNKQIGIIVINGSSDEAMNLIGHFGQTGISTGAAIPFDSGFSDAIIRRQIEHYCK
jgi:hypothetical protein